MERRGPTALELTLLAVVVLVIAGAALIGSDEKEDEKRAARSSAAAPLKVAPIKRRVERLRGLRFREPLDITFASPERAQKIYSSASAREYTRYEQLVDEEELKLLGLLHPSQELRRFLRAIEVEQILGFYDDRSKRLVVVTSESESRALREITLAHELVHALEDQHFDVSSKESLRDDRAAAESALFEGTATALMVDYAERYFDPSDALEAFGDVDAGETKLPQFVEDLLLFPYERGMRFVNAFRLDGSWRAVNNVIQLRRPRSTEQVLHPGKYAVGDAPAPVQVPKVGRLLGPQWKRLDRTGSGELDVSLVFEHVGKVRGDDAAAGWDGGRFELWRRAGEGRCRAPCIARDVGVWTLAWDREADRVQAERAFRRVFERGLRGRRLAFREGVGMWSSRGGAIGMRGEGRTSAIVFAPSPSLAARLLAS